MTGGPAGGTPCATPAPMRPMIAGDVVSVPHEDPVAGRMAQSVNDSHEAPPPPRKWLFLGDPGRR